MRKLKKILNKTSVKIIILIVIFFVVISLYFLISNKKNTDSTIAMGKATLPVIHMTYDNERINMLYGYTDAMDDVYMRDAITPLPDNYKLNFEIDYVDSIKKITYEVRSINSDNLVEKETLKDWKIKEDKIKTSINLDEIIEGETEYILKICITTDKFDQINYYTRIINEKESFLTEQMSFIYDLNEYAFDKQKANNLISYLEPDATKNDNTNYGFVTINSNYKQVSWGDLNPELLAQPKITIKEQFGSIGSFELSYIMKILNDTVTEYYVVKEFYRVNIANDRAYLLDFERKTDQIFEPTDLSVSNENIILGVDSDLAVNFKTNTTGSNITFSKQGNLWSMNTTTNEIASIFTFMEREYTDVRNFNSQHEIEIVNVDDEGNVDFLLYGYMNRGQHEGQVGIGLYHYTLKTQVVEELIFVPSSRPYQILEENIGNLLYVRGNELLYIMIDDYIYSIDIKGKESVEIASGLKDGNYVISYDSDRIAWHAQGQANTSEEIRVLNLKTGDSHTVYAEEGKYIKALGFLGEDFVYGVANKSDLILDTAGNSTLYMYEARVVDNNNQIQLTENEEGVYYLDALNEYNRINLHRAKRNGNNFEAYADSAIYDRKKEDTVLTISSTISNDTKKKLLSINFINLVATSKDLITKIPNEVVFNISNGLTIRNMVSAREKYYIYGKGSVLDVEDNITKAIRLANDQSGVVVDDKQQYIWIRGVRKKTAKLSSVNVTSLEENNHIATSIEAMLKFNGVSDVNVSELLQSGNTIIDILNKNLNNRGLDLTGCSLEEVLYFISSGQPVLGLLSNADAALIIGYDSYNVELLNLDTNVSYKIGMTEAESMFTQTGNVFISLKNK